MTSAQLAHLRPGERVVHAASGQPAVVISALFTRTGYRVRVRTASGATTITPNNAQNWTLG